MDQAEWTKLVAKAWRISPHMAVHMGERFKYPAVQHELKRLVRSDPKAVIGVSEALFYLLGEKFDPASRRALQVRTPYWRRNSTLINSGYPSGHLCRLSLHWSTSIHDMETTP